MKGILKKVYITVAVLRKLFHTRVWNCYQPADLMSSIPQIEYLKKEKGETPWRFDYWNPIPQLMEL